jgi:hypothetical protein
MRREEQMMADAHGQSLVPACDQPRPAPASVTTITVIVIVNQAIA